MAACAALPAFADARTQGKIITYDDIVRAQKAAELPTGIEIGGVYNMANRNIFCGSDSDMSEEVKKVDTWGIDMTGFWHLNKNHAVTLRFGYAWGEESKVNEFDGLTEKGKIKVSSFTLMPGYRYVWRPNRAWSVYTAANVGAARMEVEEGWDEEIQSKHAMGFSYSVEIGATYAFSEDVAIFAACQFGGNTARAEFTDGADRYKTRSQTYNTFRIGTSIRF